MAGGQETGRIIFSILQSKAVEDQETAQGHTESKTPAWTSPQEPWDPTALLFPTIRRASPE